MELYILLLVFAIIGGALAVLVHWIFHPHLKSRAAKIGGDRDREDTFICHKRFYFEVVIMYSIV